MLASQFSALIQFPPIATMKTWGSSIHHVIWTSVLVLALVQASAACDTKYIRMVYMLSCGKKKREAIQGDSWEGAFPQRRIHGSSETLGKKLLRAIINMPHNASSEDELMPSHPNIDMIRSIKNSQLPVVGLRAKDWTWILEDMMNEQDSNELHRRQIQSLLEKCCRVPPVNTCGAKDFIGACK